MEVERAEIYSCDTICWVEVWDRGHDFHSMFLNVILNVTRNDIVAVVYICQLTIRDEKSPILTYRQITKWQATNYTANITPISICDNQLRHKKISNLNPKCQNKKSFYRQKRTTIKSCAQKRNNNKVSENSPCSKCSSPARTRDLLASYITFATMMWLYKLVFKSWTSGNIKFHRYSKRRRHFSWLFR